MKRGSTIFLRLAIIIMGFAILALCASLLPGIYHPDNIEFRPLVIGMYLAAIPFFIALFQALKLLSFIDKNQAFSELAVGALKVIKYCAVSIGIIYIPLLPFLYQIAQEDDAPGILAIGFIFIGASVVVAVFAAVVQKLLQNVIDIKLENDLTV